MLFTFLHLSYINFNLCNSCCLQQNSMSLTKFQRLGDNENIRSAFKDSLTKLIAINTREQKALKELKNIIKQNKTTINLRIWLSVLAQNRNKHSQSQIQIFTFIIQQYGKGLLDPLDKVPSLEKTVFRITELLIKLFFAQDNQNITIALQKAWIELYKSTMLDEDPEMKRKLLYNCLQAILNGGADKMSQITAQVVLDGILQTSLNSEDLLFFKQIAKRTIVLFLKTTIIHPSVLTCLQIVLSYFNINNLIPLLQNITNKIISYLNIAPINSTGYKIKSEVCNVLALIGEQIDQNGVSIQERVIKVIENLATDKVWAVQVTGRKAFNIWKKKAKEWENEYIAKNQQVFQYPTAQQFYNPSMNEQEQQPLLKQNRPKVLTAENFYQKFEQQKQVQKQNINQYKFPDYTQGRYLHKNTGIGGGNNVQSVQHYYEKQQRPQETYSKKMQQIKKSIFQPKKDYTQYDETIPWDQAKSMPFPNVQNKQSFIEKKQQSKISQIQTEKPQFDFSEDKQQLKVWQKIVELYQEGKKQESIKTLLQLDDDIYFLRFMLKYSKGLLKDLTRSTSSKILKQLLTIKKTNFMQQLFFKLVVESTKLGVGPLLTNQQNLQICEKLQQCKKMQQLQKLSTKIKKGYQKSLIQ